jgi:hypothetical protein
MSAHEYELVVISHFPGAVKRTPPLEYYASSHSPLQKSTKISTIPAIYFEVVFYMQDQGLINVKAGCPLFVIALRNVW